MAKTITVSDDTYELINDQLTEEESLDVSDLQDLVGQKLFIRTVTYHLTGKVEKIVGSFLVLSTAAWIADCGRFQQAIKDGTLDEVEPAGQAFVNINSITDMFPWKHKLPTKQK